MSPTSVSYLGTPASRSAQEGAVAETARGDADPVEVERHCKPKILLLDDDPFMLGLQSRMLRSMDYRRISTAGSGEAALRMLEKEAPFDLILCDLNMPGMDGIEFLQMLNASPYCGSIILISGEGARIMHAVQKLLNRNRLAVAGEAGRTGRLARTARLLATSKYPDPEPAQPCGDGGGVACCQQWKAVDIALPTQGEP